jgi:hypothetical protein
MSMSFAWFNSLLDRILPSDLALMTEYRAGLTAMALMLLIKSLA